MEREKEIKKREYLIQTIKTKNLKRKSEKPCQQLCMEKHIELNQNTSNMQVLIEQIRNFLFEDWQKLKKKNRIAKSFIQR